MGHSRYPVMCGWNWRTDKMSAEYTGEYILKVIEHRSKTMRVPLSTATCFIFLHCVVAVIVDCDPTMTL